MCILFVILGVLIIIAGIILQVMWFGITFGTVIIGILLLIFAPDIILFPFLFSVQIGSFLMQSCNSRKSTSGKMEYDASGKDYSAPDTNNSSSKVYTSLPKRTNRHSIKNTQDGRTKDSSVADKFLYNDINLNTNTEAQIYDSDGNPLITEE